MAKAPPFPVDDEQSPIAWVVVRDGRDLARDEGRTKHFQIGKPQSDIQRGCLARTLPSTVSAWLPWYSDVDLFPPPPPRHSPFIPSSAFALVRTYISYIKPVSEMKRKEKAKHCRSSRSSTHSSLPESSWSCLADEYESASGGHILSSLRPTVCHDCSNPDNPRTSFGRQEK